MPNIHHHMSSLRFLWKVLLLLLQLLHRPLVSKARVSQCHVYTIILYAATILASNVVLLDYQHQHCYK